MISQLVSPSTKTLQVNRVPGLHPNTYKVYATIPARVYHAAFGSKQNEWIYSGLSGSVVFGRDRGSVDGEGCWFRLLEQPSGKTIWLFKIPEISFEYRIDKPFFHVFRGCSRKFGFLYNDDTEAASFAKCISATLPSCRPTAERPLVTMAVELPRSIRSRLASSAMGRLSPTMISRPMSSSFAHVAHVGGKKRETVEADEGDPSWTMVLAELPDGGVSSATVIEQHDIAEEYMKAPVQVKQDRKPQKVRRKPSPKVSI
ncbi:hypothetical protein DFH07DRAFT_569407 [Mycena maculata]|uniref:WH1 domain-containing protein n=1 Tax=Mycena maculata TaxID=230809 RepID=A0AAD7K401_9AGAR|nr:hypothetical protein DFH07DRAFT_569407 [Mycena maculata]